MQHGNRHGLSLRGPKSQISPPPFSIAAGCCSVKGTDFETSSLSFLQLSSVCISPGWLLQQKAVTEQWLSAWWRSPLS